MQVLSCFTISFLIFLLACAVKQNLTQDTSLENIFGKETQVEGPYSIEQVEKENMITVEKNGKSVALPFGFINDDWEVLKAQYQDGDQIYKFSTSAESWEKMAGREGYVLIRGDQIIAEIITLMN